MPNVMDAEFLGRIKAIRLLMQAELAQLHMRFQREQEPLVAEWMGRLQQALKKLAVHSGGNENGQTGS